MLTTTAIVSASAGLSLSIFQAQFHADTFTFAAIFRVVAAAADATDFYNYLGYCKAKCRYFPVKSRMKLQVYIDGAASTVQKADSAQSVGRPENSSLSATLIKPISQSLDQHAPLLWQRAKCGPVERLLPSCATECTLAIPKVLCTEMINRIVPTAQEYHVAIVRAITFSHNLTAWTRKKLLPWSILAVMRAMDEIKGCSAAAAIQVGHPLLAIINLRAQCRSINKA
jgi:hypothetical protein